MQLRHLIEVIETHWPIDAADDWDKPGLVVGSLDQDVSKVLLTVDITADIVRDAVEGGFDLILAHHPLLLRGVTTVAEDTAKGAIVTTAIRAGIAVYSAHTNADITATGVSATLASAIRMTEIRPLVGDAVTGHGRIGKIAEMTLLEFARQIAKALPATAGGVRIAGDPNQVISSVAICAGAGDAFIYDALEAGAEVFVTSDLRHHFAQDAIESARASQRAFGLIDISHWAAESLWLPVAANELAKLVPQVTFEVSDLRTDPWDFLVTQ